MPAIGFTIRIGGAVPGVTLTGDALKKILKEAWFEPGKDWHENLRPKHFTKEAKSEYGYEPRDGENYSGYDFWRSYTGKKQKKFGHTLPLVWSGELRDRSRTARIEPSGDGCRVFLPQANKANFHNPFSNIDMRAELTRISIPEVRQLTGVLEDALIRKLDRFDVTVTLVGEQQRMTSVAAFFHGD